MGVINGKNICQIALVVKDLDKTVEEYAKLFGVPKPEAFRVPEEAIAHTTFKARREPDWRFLIWDRLCWRSRNRMMSQAPGKISWRKTATVSTTLHS